MLFCSCLKFSSVDTVTYSQLEGGVVLFVFKLQFSWHAKLLSVRYATESGAVLYVFKVQLTR